MTIIVADQDECESPESNSCDVNAICTNTEGSYVCRCRNGYEGDGILCKGNYQYIGISIAWFTVQSTCCLQNQHVFEKFLD